MDKHLNSYARLEKYKTELEQLLVKHPELKTSKVATEIAYKTGNSHVTVWKYFRGKVHRSDIAYDILYHLNNILQTSAKTQETA